MKKLIISSSFIFLFSCNSTMNYYQVYETEFKGENQQKETIFEDNNIIVKYNLLSNNGSVFFSIFNKTKNDLTIDLQKSFFVINNFAKQYFQNRVFHYDGYKVNTTPEVKLYNGYSLNEFPLITIPSETQIFISEFQSIEERYINCDLFRYPTKKQVKSIVFNEQNSPYKYSNLITYISKKDTIRIQHNFHVNKITNYPESAITELVDTSSCGTKLVGFERIRYIKIDKPNSFYHKYSVKATSFIN
jgi:hypothetical protein